MCRSDGPLAGRTGLRRRGRGASPPASPCSFVLGHHVPEHSSRSRRAGVVPHRPQALLPSSGGTTSTRSGGHRVPTLKTKPEGNSRPRISLPLPVGGNFPLFPTAPSPLGAAPIGKHFPPKLFPEVLPLPNQEGCALLKSICFSVRHIPPISTKTKGSGARGCRFLLLPLFEGNPRPSPAGDFRLLFSTENP